MRLVVVLATRPIHMIPSVNFHLWQPCNMRCKFCYATFQDVRKAILPKGHLQKDQALQVVRQLSAHGFKKITFAGGEPTLCPWLTDLIRAAKGSGLTTMVVTNGTRLNDEFLSANRAHLDWIALSIDCLDEETNLKVGRAIAGSMAVMAEEYAAMVDRVKSHGFRLKINTVVSIHNWDQDMSEFLKYAMPERWKVLQVLPIAGQNDAHIHHLIVTELQFQAYVDRHASLRTLVSIVPESNDQVRGSYVMVDPAGRFFDDMDGTHRYSEPILQVGVSKALAQVRCDEKKFKQRGGEWNWAPNS